MKRGFKRPSASGGLLKGLDARVYHCLPNGRASRFSAYVCGLLRFLLRVNNEDYFQWSVQELFIQIYFFTDF